MRREWHNVKWEARRQLIYQAHGEQNIKLWDYLFLAMSHRNKDREGINLARIPRRY